MPPVRPVTPLFVLSLPRSGSTLVQRVLAAHGDVATAPEPWLLLPLLYALRTEGVYADYGHRVAAKAITEFCGQLPGGVDTYRAAVRDMALGLYAAASDGAPVFLDKTPRYSLVVDDLLDMFPEGRFVALWRNPLAVVASLSASWASGRWQPHLHKVDLYDSLERLTGAVAAHPDRFVTARYEDLVAAPADGFSALFAALDLTWDAKVLDDFASVRLEGSVGDKVGTAAYGRVSTEPVTKWRDTLASPVRARWCHRYLDWIGKERLSLMGYDADELHADLAAVDTRWARAVPDAVRTARGVVYDLVEPHVVKRKLAGRTPWRYVHHHD